MKQSSIFKYIPSKPKQEESNQAHRKTESSEIEPSKHANTIENKKGITICTIGYGGHSYEELISKLKANNVQLLADIRISPGGAYMECFTRSYLEQHLLKEHGIDYIWIKDLGNPYHSQPDSLVNFAKYLQEKDIKDNRLLKLIELCQTKQSQVAIMCGCKHVAQCHRNVVAQQVLSKAKNLSIECRIINL